ncbi:MAG: hypothetical protein ACI4MS_03575 [Candidatus Coproplasma sp.]
MKRTNLFKTFLCVLFSLILALICFAGCTEYKPPENSTDDPSVPVQPDDPDEPKDPDNPTAPEEDNFTVQLIVKPQSNRPWRNFTKDYYASANKGTASPLSWESLQIQWQNKRTGERHYAHLDENGKAVCEGIQGDFQVTLVFLPTGFTYEPNSQTADNVEKNIEIRLFKVQDIGTKYQYQYRYYYFKLGSTGAYSIDLNSSADRVLFQYTPPEQGTYSFRTLVDITANYVNPKLNMRTGNPSYINMAPEDQLPADQRQDGGGPEGTYTKNVYWQYKIAASYVGNCFYFELYSETRDEAKGYPITVYFLIERDGDYSDSYTTTEVEVTEDFTKTPETPSGTFKASPYRPGVSNNKLDQKSVILNTPTGRKGKKLMMLNTEEGRNGREVLMLNTEEGRGNKNVEMGANATLNDGKYYKFTYDSATDIYTLTDVAVKDKVANIDDFANSVVIGANVKYNDGEYYYYNYDEEYGMFVLTEKYAGKITAECLVLGEQASYNDGYYYYYDYDESKGIYTLTDRVYAKLNSANVVMNFASKTPPVSVKNLEGYSYTKFLAEYQDHCNSDGCYAVNEEVMLFLQRYAVSQRLFNDGNGYAELLGFNSDEYSMWMFACGYYE